MSDVYVTGLGCVSAVGFSAPTAFKNMLDGKCGITTVEDPSLSDHPVPLALIDNTELNSQLSQVFSDGSRFTRFEKIALLSTNQAIKDADIKSNKQTGFVLASTKGNIHLLNVAHKFEQERIHLWRSAEIISEYFGFANRPVVISNACISGIAALIFAQRLIEQGKYKQMVVTGADILSKFIISGFQSFMALSSSACKPFDKNRNGLNLGEGAGSIVLSSEPGKYSIKIAGGAMANDANHISGPSRTGEGLFRAISKTVNGAVPDFISAHGTATPYNDNMESIAIDRAGLSMVYLNSFKSYIGHTLGASGIIETIFTIESMLNNTIVKSKGFEKLGVDRNVNVARENRKMKLNTTLKTGSGFGGCNAAILIKKTN